MPIVPVEEIKKMKTSQNTIEEVLGGFKGQFLPHVYDNRSEALRANILEAERIRLAREGKNINMQTPEQVKAYEARKKVSTEKKLKAEMAAEIALQNK